MRKRTLTPEQQAARDERRARFKALWKKVAAMSEEQRLQAAACTGVVNVEGKSLSVTNTILIIMQRPGATVVGGFRQWLKNGRQVVKGQHGVQIWVPVFNKGAAPVEGEPSEDGEKRGFVVGTVFDISQTEERSVRLGCAEQDTDAELLALLEEA